MDQGPIEGAARLGTFTFMETSRHEPHQGNGAATPAKQMPVVHAALLAVNAELRQQISTLEQRMPWAHALAAGVLDSEHTRRAVEVIERNTRLQARSLMISSMPHE